MQAYIIKRLFLAIPTLILATILIFILTHLMPGDIIDAIIAASGGETTIDRPAMEHSLGLDSPLYVQYGRFLGVVPQVSGGYDGLLQGNLGDSWYQRKPVIEILADRWPTTLELGLLGLIISQIIAIPVGVISALRQDKVVDYAGRSISILFISVPSFWLGTVIIVFPAIWWGYMPPILLIPLHVDPIGNLKMFIAPAIILGMAISGVVMRMTRTMMLEVLKQDYIRTAWSKGLKERVVIFRHALKNALIPVITVFGLQVPVMLGGTVIIEQIFGLPGMGRLLIDATLQRDHPLISGITLLFAFVLVLINLVVDLSYAYLDPRVRYR